jgi:hypothetical protein
LLVRDFAFLVNSDASSGAYDFQQVLGIHESGISGLRSRRPRCRLIGHECLPD